MKIVNDLVDLSLVYADQNPIELAIQLLSAILLGYLVRFYYMRFAAPMGNLGNIGNVLPLLSLVTFLVIVIVKTSLALSLGLVGALSIVRFRAPIKEPMELTFIFIAIAIGLGTGAGKALITAVVIFCIIGLDILRIKLSRREIVGKTLLLEIPDPDGTVVVDNILSLLHGVAGTVRLSRLEISEQSLTIVAQMDFAADADITALISQVTNAHSDARCTLFDNKPVW